MLNFQIHLKLKQVIKIEDCHERSIMACLKLLLNEKLGISVLYSNNIIHLMNTAAVLPLSTAEVHAHNILCCNLVWHVKYCSLWPVSCDFCDPTLPIWPVKIPFLLLLYSEVTQQLYSLSVWYYWSTVLIYQAFHLIKA
jgi:hypothetical protein